MVRSRLSNQLGLSSGILNKAITLITNESRANESSRQEVNVINQYIVSILSNPALQLYPSLILALLPDVILEEKFSGKSVVYFENNQLLVIKLRQQFKQRCVYLSDY